MKKEDIIPMFPADDERYSPFPRGLSGMVDQAANGNTGVASLFRGPVVMTSVDPKTDSTVLISVAVIENEETGEAWVSGIDLRDEDERPFRLIPDFVGNVQEDGSFIVVAGDGSSFRPDSTMQFRPLILDDAEWLKVKKPDTVEELAKMFPDYWSR